MAERRPKRFWLIEVWDEHREIYKAIIGHALIVALIIGILALFHFATELLHLPDDYKATINKIEFYGTIIALVILVVGFTLEVIAFIVRRSKS